MGAAQAHITTEGTPCTGIFPTKTVGLLGIQGPTSTGIQGAGVGTPRAAAVRAIKVGFVGDTHIPKETILSIGTISVIRAIGFLETITRAVGRTFMGVGFGGKEKGHKRQAPIHPEGVPIFLPFNESVFHQDHTKGQDLKDDLFAND
jgi:hypothetical protein